MSHSCQRLRKGYCTRTLKKKKKKKKRKKEKVVRTQSARLHCLPLAGVTSTHVICFFFSFAFFSTRERKSERVRVVAIECAADALRVSKIQVLARDECGYSIVSTPQAYRPWATRVNKKEKKKKQFG